MNRKAAVESLAAVLRKCGYEDPSTKHLMEDRIVAHRPGSNSILHCDLSRDGRSFLIYIYVRVRGDDVPGDRTDISFIYPTLLAAYLRALNLVNAIVQPDPHPAVDNEFSGAYLIFQQPEGSGFPVDGSGLEKIEGIAASIVAFELFKGDIFRWDDEVELTKSAFSCNCGYTHDALSNQEWRDDLVMKLGKLPHDVIDSQQRVNPSWHFLRTSKYVLVENEEIATHFPCLVAHRLPTQANAVHHESDRGFFIRRGELTTFLSRKDHRLSKRIMNAVDPDSAKKPFITLENCTLFFSNRFLLILSTDSGLRRYRQEQIRVRDQLVDLSTVIFPETHFTWAPISAEVFEELVFALLVAEPVVRWVKQAGPTRDRDLGKDFIIDMQMPNDGKGEESQHLQTRRVLVQCKASAASVGKNKVSDIRDTIEHHGAAGYLLVVSSTVTSALVDHLAALRDKSPFYIDWWTRTEIEQRLLKRPDIAAKFRSVVTIVATRSKESE